MPFIRMLFFFVLTEICLIGLFLLSPLLAVVIPASPSIKSSPSGHGISGAASPSTHATQQQTPFNPLVKNVRLGKSVLLECSFVYDVDAVSTNVRWIKKGLKDPVLTLYGEEAELVHDQFSGRLSIRNGANLDLQQARLTDAGYYTCQIQFIYGQRVANISWRDVCYIFLNVLEQPIILNHSARSLTREPGQTVTLFCSVRGNPRPTVRWFQGEVSVPRRQDRANGRVRVVGDTESQLIVRQLQHSDAGIYTCQASNTQGSVDAMVTLTVKGGVYITHPPKNTTAMEGADLELPCKASGDPNSITYQWLKDGRELSLYPHLQSRHAVDRDGTLKLTSLHRLDDGWFICVPSNGSPPSSRAVIDTGAALPSAQPPSPPVSLRRMIVESDPELARRITAAINLARTDVYAKAYLKVLYKPQTFVPHDPIYLAVDQPGILPCHIASNPPEISVQWQKAGTSQFLKALDVPSRSRSGRQDWTLYKHVWDSVTYHDAGLYRCQGYSVLGYGKWSGSIQVIVKEMPYFTLIPEPIYQNTSGGSLTIPCQAYGEPKPAIHWFFSDGQPVEHARFLPGPHGLSILGLSSVDQGTELHCVASNPLARLVASTRLRVVHTAPAPPDNLTVTTSLFSAELAWQPGFNGGEKQAYVVYYRLASELAWTTVRVLPDGATQCELLGLLPDEEYVFSIVGINSFGQGPFSRPVSGRTLGFTASLARGYLSQLPRDTYGAIHFPKLVKRIGPSPLPPHSLEVNMTGSGDLFLSWKPGSPHSNTTIPPVLYYRVEYSSSSSSSSNSGGSGPLMPSRWHQLTPVLAPTLNLTLPRLPNGRLVAGLRFRVRAYALLSLSKPSASIRIPSTILATLLEARSTAEWWSTIIWLIFGIIVVVALMLGTFFVIRRTWNPVLSHNQQSEIEPDLSPDKFDDQCSTFSRTLHKSGLSSLLHGTATHSDVHPRSGLLTLVTCCPIPPASGPPSPSSHTSTVQPAPTGSSRKQVSFAPDLILTGYVNGMYDIDLDPTPPPSPPPPPAIDNLSASFQRFDSIDYPSSLLVAETTLRNWSFERAITGNLTVAPSTSSPHYQLGIPPPELHLSSEISSVTIGNSGSGESEETIRRRRSTSPIGSHGSRVMRHHERTLSDPASVVAALKHQIHHRQQPATPVTMETQELARWMRCQALKAEFGVATVEQNSLLYHKNV